MIPFESTVTSILSKYGSDIISGYVAIRLITLHKKFNKLTSVFHDFVDAIRGKK